VEEYGWEECESYPFVRFKIKRSENIKVKYLNEDMNPVEEDLFGFKARIFQHECDHIKGVFFTSFNVC